MSDFDNFPIQLDSQQKIQNWITDKETPKKRFISEWEEDRKKGQLRYILEPAFINSLVFSLLTFVHGKESINYTLIIFFFCFFASFFGGYLNWYFNEQKYEKLKSQFEISKQTN